jgi:hypothetical protein
MQNESIICEVQKIGYRERDRTQIRKDERRMKKTKRHNINRKRKPELPKHVMTIFQTIILHA